MQEALDTLKANRVAPESKEVNIEEVTEPVIEEVETLEEIGEIEEEVNKDESLAVERPHSWSKDNAEIWDQLTPEAQEIVAKREGDVQSDYSRNQDQTKAEREKLKTSQNALNQQKEKFLESFEVYGPKKPPIDMLDQESEAYDPDTYHTMNNKYEKAKAKADEVSKELSAEDMKAQEVWASNELKTYKEILPEFVDPKTGQAFRNKLAEYGAKAMGITIEEIAKVFPNTPAVQMQMMAKAMKWDNAMAKKKAGGVKPKPTTLSGGNSNPGRPVKVNIKEASAKFEKDRSPQAAAALMAAHRAKKKAS